MSGDYSKSQLLDHEQMEAATEIRMCYKLLFEVVEKETSLVVRKKAAVSCFGAILSTSILQRF